MYFPQSLVFYPPCFSKVFYPKNMIDKIISNWLYTTTRCFLLMRTIPSQSTMDRKNISCENENSENIPFTYSNISHVKGEKSTMKNSKY